jgi:cell division protein FtsQ
MNAAVALKRGAAPPRRKTAKPRVAAVPPRATVSLPVSRGRLIRHLVIGFGILGLAAAVVVATFAGVPQRWWADAVAASARAGFEVRHVEITGTRESPKLPIYDAALSGPTNAMISIDLPAIRARLLQQPWVADATVSRRLPDTLAIDIVERRPVAVWQFQQQLKLIDATGNDLKAEHIERYSGLPVVTGAGANLQAASALALLAGQPALAKRVDAAMLVGGRRWDIKFKTGEVLALPDTPAAAADSLKRFAGYQAAGDGLLGRGFSRFDMRLPGKMLVRGDAVKAALDAAAKAARAPKQQLAI